MPSRALVLLIALLAPLSVTGCARQPERFNLLLVVVDTLRADRLSGFGSGRGTTPRLDELAAEGFLFTHVQSPRAKTTPAVATILTGLYPHAHGVRDLITPLERDVPVLSEHLRAAGYSTGAIVGNFVLRDELSGLGRGFDLWVEDMPDLQGVPPGDVPQRAARSLTDGALCALGLGPPGADGAGPRAEFVRAGRPWFLWLHYMDPHGGYDPPPEHAGVEVELPDPIPRDDGARGSLRRRYVAEYNLRSGDRLPDGRVDAARVRARYDGEVRFADAQIGRLLDALRAAGRLEDTLVVVVADHGESLGEHDYWFEHGRYTYEVTCRVPLLVRLPDRMRERPAPGRRDGDVSLADLSLTLCELLSLPRPPVRAAGVAGGPRGRSFGRLLLADRPTSRAVFSEKVERAEKSNAVQVKAVRLGDWKYIRSYSHLPDADRPGELRLVVLSEELYDLRADPGETHDLSQEPPAAAPLERLRSELLAFAAADENFEDLARLLQERREELGRTDPRTLRVLESLGY